MLTRRVQQFYNLLHMKRRAMRVGIPFVRTKWFRVPSSLYIDGRHIPLLCRPEVSADFMDIFLRDTYHLGIIARDKGIRRVVDIGANCGFFSLAAKAYFPDADINAYEPNPIVLPTLRSNVCRIGVEVNPVAVGGEGGSVHIEHPEGQTNLGRSVPGGDIPCLSINEILKRVGKIDVLKMDCEGAEWGILEALSDESIRWLTMEYHLWVKEGLGHGDLPAWLARKDFAVIRQLQMGPVGMILARRD